MKKLFTLGTSLFCGAMVWGSPYGKALQKARQVAGQAERRNAQATAPAPRRQTAEGAEFKQLYIQIGEVARLNRGVLPGPAGIAGLKKLCGPGRVSPALLKINDFKRLTERNCPWAYVGGALGQLKRLPAGGNFPVLFSKVAPGKKEIRVLFADGSITKLYAGPFRNSCDVIDALRKSSRHAKNPAWIRLRVAAKHIDKSL